MRQLLAKDIAPFAKMLADAELKPILKDTFFGEKKAEGNKELVIELIYKLLESSEKVMASLFKFIAHMEDKAPSDIEQLPMDEFVGLLKELFGDKNFGSFFKFAAK
jgi:hypothetical protein